MPVCYRGPVSYPTMPSRAELAARRPTIQETKYRSPESRGKPWTDDEKSKLRAMYATASMERMKEVLPGRTARSITHMASVLKVQKSPKKIWWKPREEAG